MMEAEHTEDVQPHEMEVQEDDAVAVRGRHRVVRWKTLGPPYEGLDISPLPTDGQLSKP